MKVNTNELDEYFSSYLNSDLNEENGKVLVFQNKNGRNILETKIKSMHNKFFFFKKYPFLI